MEKEFNQQEYLENKIKYLGFGESEKIKNDLKKGIESGDDKFSIETSYPKEKLLKGNEAVFNLNFSKSEKGGVFLNSFNAVLRNEKKEDRSHSFKANGTITAKEAVNLLEGRAVKTELENKEGQKQEVFVRLNLKEKNEYGNYKTEYYHKNYGIDVDKIMEKSKLVFKDDAEKENIKHHLEKGNITNISFKDEKNQLQEGKAYLNVQYKMLNMYDKNLNRINTNKPLKDLEIDQEKEKSKVVQQSISRGI
ncbi:hypothetical protein [Riemerella columbipharyngis]|uniref:DUF3945 domain-containing protein n=1 Tax=Riemerella columbipharyngis TaxID=1071918 RepID=A0A1G6ZC93_9FLAO|nr:hypothetical protein [Riemerella columbipharyngis]SDE00248.1 hypothetical protein SAMN05421544_10237 [Riemerella columbipharyngis]